MALARFDFPFHNVQHGRTNPAPHVQFNNGWTFSAKPTSPEIRTFTLTFSGMQYFVNAGGAIDITTKPQQNMQVMDNFYVAHGTWDTFVYAHPVFGDVNVRFSEPLDVPKLKRDGVVEDFTLKLVEMLQ